MTAPTGGERVQSYELLLQGACPQRVDEELSTVSH